MTTYSDAEMWRNLHRFCHDTPSPIAGLTEARFVLTEHAGHGPACRQFAAALRRATGSVIHG